jgi:hypothetical protein
MPLNLAREDRRLLIATAVLFLGASALAVLLSPGSDADAAFATTYSTVSEGAKAGYLLLQESGYHIRRWERQPAQLPDSPGVVLLLTDPTLMPTSEDVAALNQFVRRGGTLILAGSLAAVFTSFPAPAPAEPEGWKTFAALAPSAQARSADSIKLNTAAHWTDVKSGIALYGDQDVTVVMQFPFGKGQVLWLASSSPLSNAGLREPGNLEFLLASVGSHETQVLWDEYFHGHRESAGTVVAHPQMKWLGAQLAFFAVAVLVTFSRRHGPLRAPVAESRLSPLEFVTALGDLYERAGAANVAVDIYYERFRYWLTRRLGLRASATPETISASVRDRFKLEDPEFLALLKACESARFYHDLSRKEALNMVRKLHGYARQFNLFRVL